MEQINNRKEDCPLHQIAEIAIKYKRIHPFKGSLKVRSSQDVVNVFRQVWNNEQIDYIEHVYLLLISQSNSVLGVIHIGKGNSKMALIEPKIIFGAVIKAHAAGFVVAHNHPSGNLKPSSGDIELTKKLKQGAAIMNIQMLDHIILSSEGYYSFADEGTL